ncbi:DUF1194 domain-containing protein [Luteolibacter marinus]|uniref:DUF1194 domain-containing protein n=1 Tax=Luteolibacter marinus TaxID=2776705 RepID=UPI0018680164|nr:DUF1194 domain-containing protein [Luteolibacter marinus]
MSFGILTAGLQAQTAPEPVDSELILLVDVTSPGFNPGEMSSVIGGLADAMSSGDVMNSIQSGAYGRIAVSLMFYGDSSTQTVGIPWMMIGNSTDAQQFADLIRGVSIPSSGGNSALAPALEAAALYFGSETGASDNGFQSVSQMIELVVATEPKAKTTAEVTAARDAALASGVDVINAIALGNKSTDVEAYFAANVIGGDVGGLAASSTSSAIDTALPALLSGQLSGGVAAAASDSLTSVPEPSPVIGLISGLSILLIRRHRSR